MGTPVYASRRAGRAHSRRGLGMFLVFSGSIIAAVGAIVVILCSPIFLGVRLLQPFAGLGEFLVGLGVAVALFGPLLIFTRWQFSRELGICPSCGAGVRQGNSFCTHCGNRLW